MVLEIRWLCFVFMYVQHDKIEGTRNFVTSRVLAVPFARVMPNCCEPLDCKTSLSSL